MSGVQVSQIQGATTEYFTLPILQSSSVDSVAAYLDHYTVHYHVTGRVATPPKNSIAGNSTMELSPNNLQLAREEDS